MYGPRRHSHHGDRPAVDDQHLREVELSAALKHAAARSPPSGSSASTRVVVARVGGARVKEQRHVARAAPSPHRIPRAASGWSRRSSTPCALVAQQLRLDPVACRRAAHEPDVDRAFADGGEELAASA